jgi:glycosyltransferase involved in cell wall biosynthesis
MARSVGVNLLYLVPGVVGGSEDYAVRVLRAVAAHREDDLDFVLFARDSFVAAYPDLARSFEVRTLPLPANRALRVAAESTWLARSARRVDVLHHFGGRVPAVGSRRSTVTVHDLQPLHRPESFSAVKRRFLAFSLPRSVRKAELVIAVSEWVRRTIVETLAVPHERTAVVSAPCEPIDRAQLVGPECVAALPSAVRGIVERGDRFFIYPVIAYPHKNHRTLIEAFAPVARAHADVHLVLTGGAGPADDDVRQSIHRFGLDDRVVRTGRIERAQLDTALALAHALVFPSLYEGFGLGVIEALRVGTPAIVADATALPEAVGEGGVLVEPLSIGAWSDALESALAWTSDDRAQLVAAGAHRLESLQPARVAAHWQELHRRLW